MPGGALRAGYAEVVKYGLLGDADFFAWCDANSAALLAGDAQLREYAVAQSVAAKARIVAEDERDCLAQIRRFCADRPTVYLPTHDRLAPQRFQDAAPTRV